MSLISRLTSLRCEVTLRGRCIATPAQAGATGVGQDARPHRPGPRRPMPWRRIEVSCSSTNRAAGSWLRSPVRSSSRLTVCTTRPATPGSSVKGGPERAPRRQDEEVPVESGRDLSELVVRADGEQVERGTGVGGVAGEPLRAPGQSTDGEAVAVALGDRHDARVGPHRREQVRAPALAVDRQGQAHRAPRREVELERLVEGTVERQVPLAGVLDGLAAGADLELDQPDVGVVGFERLGDAAQVVDLGAGVQCVADHRPLDGVGAAHVALLRGRCAVGVPRMGADPDRDGRGDQVALVAGQPHLDPVRVLGRERVVHRLEVGQRARGEVVALGGVDVEVVEGLEVLAVTARHLDAGLVGLLDVAAPQLVHAGQHVGLGARPRPSPPTSGIWKLNCGWPAEKPPSADCCCQPSSCSCATTRAPVLRRARGEVRRRAGAPTRRRCRP